MISRPIPDLDEWNARIAGGGSPEVLPDHPAPRFRSQTRTAEKTVDGWGTFTEAEGEPEDDLPEIYQALDTENSVVTTEGSASWYLSSDAGFPSIEVLTSWTGGVEEGSWTSSGTQARAGTEPGDIDYFCESTSDSGDGTPWSFDWVEAPLPDPATTATATERTTVIEKYTYTEAGPVSSLQGCPLSDPEGFGENDEKEADATKEVSDVDTLSDAAGKEGLIADAAAELPDWPEGDPEDGLASAAASVEWPTIGDLLPWPAIEEGPPDASATGEVVGARVQVGPPDGYEKPYFKAKWDLVFYPSEWLEWEAADPETRGDEPEAVPTLSGSGEWEREGEDEWSPYIALDPPTTPGELRMVNVATLGYRCRFGEKWKFHGERWFPPE